MVAVTWSNIDLNRSIWHQERLASERQRSISDFPPFFPQEINLLIFTSAVMLNALRQRGSSILLSQRYCNPGERLASLASIQSRQFSSDTKEPSDLKDTLPVLPLKSKWLPKTRNFSTVAVGTDVNQQDEKPHININRPLSPHLSIYRPQMNSVLSIFHRISGGFLSGMLVSGYLAAQVGSSSLTFYNVYKLLLISIPPMITSSLVNLMLLAMCYHTVTGIRHLVYDYTAGALKDSKKH